ncbi:hypothetical protein [Nocardioides cavernae]|nr:hypothetical protein [Nocardioides cavernae]
MYVSVVAVSLKPTVEHTAELLHRTGRWIDYWNPEDATQWDKAA